MTANSQLYISEPERPQHPIGQNHPFPLPSDHIADGYGKLFGMRWHAGSTETLTIGG
jgi:hypothetical protein